MVFVTQARGFVWQRLTPDIKLQQQGTVCLHWCQQAETMPTPGHCDKLPSFPCTHCRLPHCREVGACFVPCACTRCVLFFVIDVVRFNNMTCVHFVVCALGCSSRL